MFKEEPLSQPTLRDLPNSERLQNFNLPSLSHHQDRMDLAMTFKIFNGAVLVDRDSFVTMNTSYNTRSNQFKEFNKTATRRTGFSQRIINKWNSFSNEVATSSNVLSFKINLDPFFV